MSASQPRRAAWRSVVWAVRILQVRLRFLIVLLVAFLVVGQWHVLRNYWDKLTRFGSETAQAVSLDTEYFCPMCPGVLSDWPSKCPVCNMALVRRKKGEAVPLPSGVLARMQLSPYRVQLAGIQTAVLDYRPLAREIKLAGLVEPLPDRPDLSVVCVKAEVFDRDIPLLQEGQEAEVRSEALPGQPLAAQVRMENPHRPVPTRALQVRLEIENPRQELRPAMFVTARVAVPMQQLEPFRSMPTAPPPLQPGDLREVYGCPEHPDILLDRPGRCPVDPKDELEPRPLAANQRLGWWCPAHARVTADQPGGACSLCNGMKLLPRVLSYNPPGHVLALPHGAVVDTGAKKVVYVERMPGMFDGVEVVVGPRCGDFYPVVRGLDPGQRVATAGAFLLDAETRLNPNVATGYFGATRSGR
jgi:hypothetical protein